MADNKLFRKSALDKMSSPERLDVLMEVTSPKGWLALWTVGAILIGVVLWSIFGSIPTRIDGQGMLIRGGSLRELQSVIDGELIDLRVSIGDEVAENQTVAVLSVANREDAAVAARQEYENLQREHESATAEDNATIAGYRATIAGHRADRQNARAELSRKQEELPRREQQLRDGITTTRVVEQLRTEIRRLEAEVNRLDAAAASVNAQIRATEQRIRGRELQVEAAEAEYERLQQGNVRDTEIKTPVAGRVVALPLRVGDLVPRGEAVAMVEPESATMEPVIYISSTQGGRIRPGMEAEVSPTSVKREEYGFMKATIGLVGQFPVSVGEMTNELGSDVLAQELLQDGAKIEVRADLLPTTETPSGYEWSSSSGPPFLIRSGERITASILVDRRRPITYVLPLIRGTVGID
jgi:HlyD family secretion protein